MADRVVKYINRSEIENLVREIKHGEFFSIFFSRVAPKCQHCQKSNKKWKGLARCPICGEPLSYERETMAQTGVSNPRDIAIVPKGTGVSGKEALETGLLKYYEYNGENGNGCYRSCRIDNILRLSFRGVDYFVV